MSVLERPMTLGVEGVTHHSIELSWQEAFEKTRNNVNTDGDKIQVCLQEQTKNGEWVVVYNGLSERGHLIENLEPNTEYTFRLQFRMKDVASEWSPEMSVSTKKEPYYGTNLHRYLTLQRFDDVEMVLKSGEVKVDTPDKFGLTPLMVSSQKGYINMIGLLVEYGADVNFQNDAGKTSLMLACYAAKKDSVKELRQCGASYDIHDKSGATALHYAADSESCELIDFMLQEGALDINCRDRQGWTPLIRTAAVTGSRDVGKLLIRRGADIDCKDKDGKTALMTAVINGHLALVDVLLEAKADVTIRTESGRSLYDLAVSMERTRVAQRLEEYMPKISKKIK